MGRDSNPGGLSETRRLLLLALLSRGARDAEIGQQVGLTVAQVKYWKDHTEDLLPKQEPTTALAVSSDVDAIPDAELANHLAREALKAGIEAARGYRRGQGRKYSGVDRLLMAASHLLALAAQAKNQDSKNEAP